MAASRSSSRISWLAGRLPAAEYELTRQDGQFVLNFHGRWHDTTHGGRFRRSPSSMSCASRAALRSMGRFALDVTYARAKTKMWEKVERLKRQPDIRISDFGTAAAALASGGSAGAWKR